MILHSRISKKFLSPFGFLLGAVFFSAAQGVRLPDHNAVLGTFEKSYRQATPEVIATWDSTFRALEIHANPLAMAIEIIRFFSRPEFTEGPGLYTLNEIIAGKKTNILSDCITLVALMQAQGWDVEGFYGPNEYYIGLNLSDDWVVRKGSWVEMDGKKYYLKEFDDSTAVGETRIADPAASYHGLRAQRSDLKPIPVVKQLPIFGSRSVVSRRIKWRHDDSDHEITVAIPGEQLRWTKNLPASIYGMVYSGFDELRKLGLAESLREMISGRDEYDQVDFLYKFCQSETDFKYQPGLPIRSVTRQIWEGKNDCDGRSVLLCCLLHAALDFPLENIVFIGWENHLTLGVKPRTEKCLAILQAEGKSVGDNFYILDPAYMGATHWGSKMKNLPEEYEIIKPR
jgi:hypothetical protein